jgi:biopolymer transport protein TolR
MADTGSLSAAQRAKIRRLSAPRELAPDEEGGELNIVPFLDIIMNILIFVLATVAVTFTSTIETTPPAIGGGGIRKDIKSAALNLTVIVVGEGFSLKASGGNVSPGCTGVGPGLAIPKSNGQFDYAALNDCAARLKASSPDFADEETVSITANPGTEYQIVIGVMDALRHDFKRPAEVLFDKVNFKVSK